MEDSRAVGIRLRCKLILHEPSIHIPPRQRVQRVDSDISHLLRRGNSQRLHRLDQFWNRLTIHAPETGKSGVVYQDLPGQDFQLLRLAQLHKFRFTRSKPHQRHKTVHSVNLVFLAAKELHLSTGQREAKIKMFISHFLNEI